MLVYHQYIEKGGAVYGQNRPPEPMKKIDMVDK
jgi:hypothetical protein